MAPKKSRRNRRRNANDTTSQVDVEHESQVNTEEQREIEDMSVDESPLSQSQGPASRRTPKLRNQKSRAKGVKKIQTAIGGEVQNLSPEVIDNLKTLFIGLYIEKYMEQLKIDGEQQKEKAGGSSGSS